MFVRPLIWDFDDSVLEVSSTELRISLQSWQEQIRFGCRTTHLFSLEPRLVFPDNRGCVFLGSGDYHHVSLLLLKRAAAKVLAKNEKLDVIVCDNHPDNMRYPFGIHCGSWVYHASHLPGVGHIDVIGITSDDITVRHCWENYLSPLMYGKVRYWSIGKSASWLNWLGAKRAHRVFSSPTSLLEAFVVHLEESRNIYLSLDKDVFGKEMVETNWDQGCFEFNHIEQLFTACGARLVGMDVTGEISSYRYQGLFKRTLAKLDGLVEPDPVHLKSCQEKQRSINKRIIKLLSA